MSIFAIMDAGVTSTEAKKDRTAKLSSKDYGILLAIGESMPNTHTEIAPESKGSKFYELCGETAVLDLCGP